MAPPRIMNSTFRDADKGLVPPVRQLGDASLGLQIKNLDRADPPQYVPNGYSRIAAFNRNVFKLTGTAAMPPINVVCDARGFDPGTTPIIWRLQIRYIVGRYQKTNHDDDSPTYAVTTIRGRAARTARHLRYFDQIKTLCTTTAAIASPVVTPFLQSQRDRRVPPTGCRITCTYASSAPIRVSRTCVAT